MARYRTWIHIAMSKNNEKQPKGLREAFAEFFEQPTRPGLRKILQDNVGEFDHIDFKEAWPAKPKLARHILGFANSRGGIMIVGVKEAEDKSLTPDGLPSLTDKTDIKNDVKKFLPHGLDYNVFDFHFTESEYAAIKGKTFQVLLVEDRPEHLPFLAVADGTDIKCSVAYVRDGAETIAATHHQFQAILNRRIATGHSTQRELSLNEHLDELKALYGRIPERLPFRYPATPTLSLTMSNKNPVYPKESFDAFIARLIETKKNEIEALLLEKHR